MIEPIKEAETTSFTLSQFLIEIKQTIDRKFKGGGYWVRGELSDWRKNGVHHYGELIEFDELSHQSVAKVRINMWAGTAKKVIPKFHHAHINKIARLYNIGISPICIHSDGSRNILNNSYLNLSLFNFNKWG